ncbi:MAG: hypothetical protein A2341_09500 [Deltaproteobacteria bacterium RIFOXYB12_FULL_58_9]|nr:MAG: hypothetical protein A2341_09500 [Deltaproteobacteria bacterium RIFOXYB12_FULL_58_9]
MMVLKTLNRFCLCSLAWAWAGVGFVGCGGEQASTGPAQVAAVVEEGPKKKPPEEGPEAIAAARFDKLAKDLEDLGHEGSIDRSWLESELRAVLKLNPDHSTARFNLAMLEGKDGGGDKCAMYEAILDDDDGFAPAAENLAACKIEKGDVDGAAEVYREIIKKDPKALTSRMALARILQRRGEHKAAIELCRKVLQRKADAIEAFRILAESYFAIKDVSMAELIIGKGLTMKEDDVQLHYLAAQILLQRGQLAGGIAKLQHVLKLKPKWLKVRGELAQLLVSNDAWGNAMPHFEAILKEAPNHRPSRIGFAVCATHLGRYDESEKIYKDLLAKDANDVDGLWNYGYLLWRHLKKYDDAMAMFTRFEKAVGDDKKAAAVGAIVKKIDNEKKNIAARQAREERDNKRRQSIDAACAAVASGGKPDAAAIGSDDDRIKAAWDLLLVTAVAKAQEGDTEGFRNFGECALAIIPETPGPGMVACAQMRVNWVQLQDQVGLLVSPDDLRRAKKTIAKAVECDPENPDPQIFLEQIDGLILQAEEAAKGAEQTPADETPAGGEEELLP